MTELRTVLTAGGGVVAYEQWGPRGGMPVFFLHGLPGSRFVRLAEGAYDRYGIRVITLDRPGYGESTRAPHRTVADGAADVLAIADLLEIERFSVVGFSMGGPFALAVAASVPHRVVRCASAVGLAPYDAPGLEWFAGMDDQTVAEWRVAEEGEDALVERGYPEVRAWVESIAQSPDLPEPLRSTLAEWFGEGLRPGPYGIVDDYLAVLAPWGFALGDISCPTRIVAAREDTVDPPAHSEWLAARIPRAELVLVDGDHMSPREAEDEALFAWLAGRSG